MRKNRFVHPLSKTFLLLATLFMTVSYTNGQDPQKNRTTSYGMGFVEYLPAGYSSSTAKYPAIIFLHGSGERGTGTASDLQKVRNQGPPKLIKNGEKMCFTVNGKTECFIVLSPQTNKWNWKYDVIPFIKYALANYRIDPARVYVTGLSMGGEGAWLTAGLEDNAPNLIAAVGVMCGRASQAVGFTVASRKIPVWAFHGNKDTAIGIGSGLIPITAMQSVNANPAPIWTVYAGVSHGGCWDRGYRTDHSVHNPNLYEWFLTKRKGTTSAPDPTQKNPVANAGADKTITLPTSSASFTATGSDSDGTIKSYKWTKISGPSAKTSNMSTRTLQVSNAKAGTFVFRVTVTDNNGLKGSDDVKLTVKGSTIASNKPPVVEGGAKKYITLPTRSTSFTAIASDPDGSIASYKWIKIGGGSISMSGTTSRTMKVNNARAGTYVFVVEVKDNKGAKADDTVYLKVQTSTASVDPTEVNKKENDYTFQPLLMAQALKPESLSRNDGTEKDIPVVSALV